MFFTAWENTDLPAIFTLPPVGWYRLSHPLPSAVMWVDRIPCCPSGSGPSTTAPAPSPNKTQVFRSVQSRTRVSTSTPTTSTRFIWPVRTIASARAIP